MYGAPDLVREPAAITDTVVSRAAKNEAAVMKEIAETSGIDAWTVRDYESEITRRGSICLLAGPTTSGPAGLLVARFVQGNESEFDIEIYNVAVRPELRRTGIGKALLFELLKTAKVANAGNIWLEVRESNTNAIEFYLSVGFSRSGSRPGFYRAPSENAVVMKLRLLRK